MTLSSSSGENSILKDSYNCFKSYRSCLGSSNSVWVCLCWSGVISASVNLSYYWSDATCWRSSMFCWLSWSVRSRLGRDWPFCILTSASKLITLNLSISFSSYASLSRIFRVSACSRRSSISRDCASSSCFTARFSVVSISSSLVLMPDSSKKS